MSANFSLPPHMKFGEAQVISIIAYSIMLVIGLYTNSTFLYNSLKERMIHRNRNRMSLLLIHLSIADLFVSLPHGSDANKVPSFLVRLFYYNCP